MKKMILSILILCLAGMVFTAKAQEVKSLTDEEFKKEIWNYTDNKDWKFLGDKPAIIDLYATWCPPCKKLAPILEQVQKEYGEKIQIYKVDVDKEKSISQLFNVKSIPVMVFIPRDGKPFTVVGLRPQNQIEQIIQEKLDIKK